MTIVGVVVALAAGWGVAGAAPAAPDEPPSIEVVSKAPWRSARACQVRGTAQRLRALTLAVSGGKAARPELLFAREPRFMWYSMADRHPEDMTVPEERITSIYRAGELRRYFDRRAAARESMRLVAVKLNYFDRRRQRAGLELVLTRHADDLAAKGVHTAYAQGKGSLDCRRGRIIGLSLGMAYGHEVREPCGWKSSSGTPPRILACGPRR